MRLTWKQRENLHFYGHLVAMALTLIVMPMAAYVGLNATLCERIEQGVYDAQTQEAMKLNSEVCALPWYKQL